MAVTIRVKIDHNIVTVNLNADPVFHSLGIGHIRGRELRNLASHYAVDTRANYDCRATVGHCRRHGPTKEEEVEVGRIVIAEDEPDGVVVAVHEARSEDIVFPQVGPILDVVVQGIGALASRPDRELVAAVVSRTAGVQRTAVVGLRYDATVERRCPGVGAV